MITVQRTDADGTVREPMTFADRGEDQDLLLGWITFAINVASGPFSIRFTPGSAAPDGPDAPWRQPSSAWLTEELVDDAHSAFSEAYRQEFPYGGDAGDDHNATREGLVAALLLAHGRSSAPEGKQP